MLQWIKIDDLVVDDRYQRPIAGAGRLNVKRIVEDFRWSRFAPVIIAPIPGGLYAIIDGQHRATAAAILGFETVPSQIVTADETEQAAAFKSINGQVTKIHALSLHHAALVAGEPEALAIQSVAEAAGVSILRYPRGADRLEPGDTLALGAIRSNLRAYSREIVITALTCVTETENNRPGALSAQIIHALCATLGGNTTWAEAGEALLKAFDEIDLEIEFEEARVTRRPKMTATWEVLVDRLTGRLVELMPKKNAA